MRDKVESELDLYIKKSDSNFFVLQIGANDGKMADPIYSKVISHRWKGVMVEPVKHLFDRLRKNYEGHNLDIKFENSVVTTYTGEIDFYQFPESYESNKDFPYWANGVGSVLQPFNSPGHNNLKSKNFKMLKKKTPCIKFSDLIRKYDITNIDLLQIDIEGYDGTLLRSIDFDLIKPKFIRYEDKHIDTALKDGLTEISSKQVIEYLKSNGYTVGNRTNGFDRVCKLK